MYDFFQTEEDSDSDEEQYEQIAADDELSSDTIIKKNVSSLRLDSIVKAGLGLTKKLVLFYLLSFLF